MSTLAENILSVIEKKPGIRTIEICDAFDCDIDLVEAILQPLVRDKKIVAVEVSAPDGRRATAYHLPGATIPKSVPNPAKKDKSKVDLAIDFIQARGSATNQQLRTVMGLDTSHSPQAFLHSAVIDNRLARTNDGRWILGEALTKRSQSAPQPNPVTNDTGSSAFRAGLFSDGELHLWIAGKLISLTRDQTDTLRQLFRGATA